MRSTTIPSNYSQSVVMHYLRIVLLLSLVSYSVAAMTVTTTLPNPYIVEPGKSATIDFTIQNFDEYSRLNSQYNVSLTGTKVDYGPAGKEYVIDIFVGLVILTKPSEFYKWPNQDAFSSGGKIHIKIPIVTSAVNGTYKCLLKTARDNPPRFLAEGIVNLFVLENVQNIKNENPKISYKEIGMPASGSGTSLEIKETIEVDLKCEVSGGNPPPEVTMYLNNVDITHRFINKRQAVVKIGNSDEAFKRKFEYRTSITCPSCKFTVQDSGTLECRAKVGKLPTVFNSKYMSVTMKPLIKCNKLSYDVKVNDENKVIACNVMANPQVTSTSWELENGNITLREGQHYPLYDVYNEAKSRTNFEVSLKIHKVHKSHFGKIRLVVVNGVGTTMQTVDLLEKAGAGGSIGGCSQLSSSQLTVQLLAVFSSFLVFASWKM